MFCQFGYEAKTSHDFALGTFNRVITMSLLRYNGSDVLLMMHRSWVKKQMNEDAVLYTPSI